MAADDPRPVLATSGLDPDCMSPVLNVIEENGGREASASGVRGKPRSSILKELKRTFYLIIHLTVQCTRISIVDKELLQEQ